MPMLPHLRFLRVYILPLLLLQFAHIEPAMSSVTLFAEDQTVRDFGAVGDGINDDTDAIEKAIREGVGDVRFPKGRYRITRTIPIVLAEHGVTSLIGESTATLVMQSAGPTFHFIGTHEGTADPSTFKPEYWTEQRMPTVRGLEFVGENPQANGIEISGVMQMTITDSLFRKLNHAIHLTKRNRNLLISNCHIYENRGVGVYFDEVNLHQSNIVGSHISYCAAGGIVIRGGEVRNVHIGSCDIESNMTPEHPATANILIDSTNGSTDEVAITGCTIQHNSKSAGSANIRIIGRGITSAKSPEPTQEGHIAITGNVLSDVMQNIHLQDVRGATITGNTFWEGFEHDLLLENCQAIVIGANDFDRNPRYVVNGNLAKDLGGIVLSDCQDCKLSSFLVKGVWGKQAAVWLKRCQRCTVHDLSILDCDGAGLELDNCSSCKVTSNLIRDDRTSQEKQTPLPPPLMRVPSVPIREQGGQGNVVRDNMLGDQ